MARASKFQNQSATKSAIIELIDMETTDLDETDPQFLERDLSGTKDYPYKKTYSGFLQGYKTNF